MRRVRRIAIGTALAIVTITPLRATMVWGSLNLAPTEDIKNACYGGEDPGPVAIDECGCNQLSIDPGGVYWDGEEGGCKEIVPG